MRNLTLQEHTLNESLRKFQADRRRELERIEHEIEAKEQRVHRELERFVREIASTKKEIQRRCDNLQKEFEHSLKK